MIVLVINAGSSSIKYQLFDMRNKSIKTEGLIERIGQGTTTWTHQQVTLNADKIEDHQSAMYQLVDCLTDPLNGVIPDISAIDAIGHRIVQGGEKYASAVIIDHEVKQAIRDNIPLAPLHNPANLNGIEITEKMFPGVLNIAVFDTEFHQSMPAEAFLYGIPYEMYEKHKIRKYGFHGTSHKYVASVAANLMGRNLSELNLISVHLGSGCSVCAIENGKSTDTSMGMTPASGVMMASRSGDLDPGVINYLIQQTGMTIEELTDLINNSGGFAGICGLSDMRDIHEALNNGDPRARLAVEMFCYQVKKYIGSYMAILGRVDALIFTAGIGENDPMVRALICSNMDNLGIILDVDKNKRMKESPAAIHSEISPVQIWVISTNEELQIAVEVEQLINK